MSHNALARTGNNSSFHANTFLEVFHHYTEWGWERLPVNYLSSEYLTCHTDALAGEVTGRQDDTKKDTPEQTAYENELPRKQVLTLQAHYIIIGFENVNCCH